MMSSSPLRPFDSVPQLKGWVEGVVKAEGRRQDDNVGALREQVENLKVLSRGDKENESRAHRIEEVIDSSIQSLL